jgi:hypothetical protein
MPQCLIPNCPNNATNNFGIRLRREDTTAIWAHNTTAYLCDDHAAQGYTVNVELIPNRMDTITSNITAGGRMATRTTPIVNEP